MMSVEEEKAALLFDTLLDLKLAYWQTALYELGDLVDVVTYADDYGTQVSQLISPRMFRRQLKPRVEQIFALQAAMAPHAKRFFHSDGNVRPLIPDFIEIGVDILELLQPDLFGIERLADAFGGKVCFCCSVDHQRLACTGSRDEIFRYARRLNDRLGAFDGGFIAYIEDYSSLGMSEQNYQWIREAFHGLNEG